MLNHITDSDLRAMYWEEGLSGKQIADRLCCTPSAVSLRMKASGIPTRRACDYPPTEKMKRAWKVNGHNLGVRPENVERAKNLGRRNKGRRKRNDYEFGGHEKKRRDGYIKVYVPNHPHASSDGYVMKHTLVMEMQIGRFLQKDEVVHHINHIRDDNRIDNLRLMTRKEHMSLHMKERHKERRKAAC